MTVRSAASAALALSVLLAAPRPARACEATFAVLWTYPKDGQADVPTNAKVFAIGAYDVPIQVDLDGQPLARGPFPDQFEPGSMTPETEHVLRISARADPAQFRTLSFRTGTGPVSLAAPIAEVGPAIVGRSRTLNAACHKILVDGECYATEDAFTTLETSATPLAWWVMPDPSAKLGPLLWPGECGPPEVRITLAQSRCFSLLAVNELGLATPSGPYCRVGKVRGDAGVVVEEPAADGGCSHGGDGALTVGLAGGAVLLGRRVRRPSHKPAA